jgi:hypothetical protein
MPEVLSEAEIGLGGKIRAIFGGGRFSTVIDCPKIWTIVQTAEQLS